MARRLLPEAAYDFWALDGRDGEKGPLRATLKAARKDARDMRREARKKPHIFFSSQIWVEWSVNEEKVRRLLATPKRSTP
jgi:hypothetical protein